MSCILRLLCFPVCSTWAEGISMNTRPFGSKYYEDPTIAQVSALEYDRVWGRIGNKVATGMWFYRAREVVLAEEIPDIAKAYGRTVAQRVSKAIQHTSPERIPKPAQRAAKDY